MERMICCASTGFYFRQAREDSRYLLGSQGEDIMARMQLSGSNAWGDLQAYLTSTVEVDYQDSVTNLSAIRNLAYDPDGCAEGRL